MLQRFLEGTDLMTLPVIGLFFFMAVFIAAVLRTMSRSRSGLYERMAALPLEEDPADLGRRGVTGAGEDDDPREVRR